MSTGTDFNDRLTTVQTEARYCRCVATQDWAGFAERFTEDGTLDRTPAAGLPDTAPDTTLSYTRLVP